MTKTIRILSIRKKSAEILFFSPYYEVCLQFEQHWEHVNVISSSRNVRKSRYYAILDAQWIFNGQLKNIHCLVEPYHARRTIFHFLRMYVDMYTGYLYTPKIFVSMRMHVYRLIYVDFEFGSANISIDERYRTTLFFG